MTTEPQKTDIRNYLLSKKLPIDILMEVNDHFLSQIANLQKEENLVFEDAFEKVKNSWNSELKLYWDGSWDLIDKNKFVKKIKHENLISLLKLSFFYSFLVGLVLCIFSLILNFHIFKYVFVSVMAIISLYPIFNYFKNYQDFQLVKKYRDYILISIQEFTILNLSCSYFYFRFFGGIFSIAKAFGESFIHFDIKTFLFGVVFSYFILIMNFLSFLSQKKYLQKVEKIKDFLPFLQPSK